MSERPASEDRAWDGGAESEPGLADLLGEADGDSGVLFLVVDDPRVDGYVPPPEPTGLSAATRKRRALADRLAGILVNNPVDDKRAWYAVESLSLPAKVRYARAVQSALVEAPIVADKSEPGAVKIQSDVGGVVIRLHGPTWSLVFRLTPYRVPVLFVTDDMPDRARRVDTDREWLPEIHEAIEATLHELSRYAPGGDKCAHPRWRGTG